jgi:hypothetical protein
VRKIPLIVSLILLAIGLAITIYDITVIREFGFDVNDVADIGRNGELADWPTGERPGWAFVPAFVYGIGFCLAAVLVLAPWPEPAKAYRGRVVRGTE